MEDEQEYIVSSHRSKSISMDLTKFL